MLRIDRALSKIRPGPGALMDGESEQWVEFTILCCHSKLSEGGVCSLHPLQGGMTNLSLKYIGECVLRSKK